MSIVRIIFGKLKMKNMSVLLPMKIYKSKILRLISIFAWGGERRRPWFRKQAIAMDRQVMESLSHSHTHLHTHTHTHSHSMSIQNISQLKFKVCIKLEIIFALFLTEIVCACECVCVCARVRVCVDWHSNKVSFML